MGDNQTLTKSNNKRSFCEPDSPTSCCQEFCKAEVDCGQVGTKEDVHLFLRVIKNNNNK